MGRLLLRLSAAGDGFGGEDIAEAGDELGPATCGPGAAGGKESLHRNGMELDPPQANITQEMVIEVCQGQHLAVRGDAASATGEGGKREHRRLLHRYFR
jgi:hypothetical protein